MIVGGHRVNWLLERLFLIFKHFNAFEQISNVGKG